MAVLFMHRQRSVGQLASCAVSRTTQGLRAFLIFILTAILFCAIALASPANGAKAAAGLYAAAEARAAAQATAVEERVKALPPLSDAEVASIEARIRAVQERAGYTSDYDSWIAKVTPPDLE